MRAIEKHSSLLRYDTIRIFIALAGYYADIKIGIEETEQEAYLSGTKCHSFDYFSGRIIYNLYVYIRFYKNISKNKFFFKFIFNIYSVIYIFYNFCIFLL